MSPLYTKRPYFQKTSTGFFLETPIPYTSEALKKENVRKYLEGAAVDQAVFAIQLSILNRMSFLGGFAELGRPAILTVPAPSLQLEKPGIRRES